MISPPTRSMISPVPQERKAERKRLRERAEAWVARWSRLGLVIRWYLFSTNMFWIRFEVDFCIVVSFQIYVEAYRFEDVKVNTSRILGLGRVVYWSWLRNVGIAVCSVSSRAIAQLPV